MKVDAKSELYRKLPSVDELVRQASNQVADHGHAAVTDAARNVLQSLRDEIATGNLNNGTLDTSVQQLTATLEIELQQSLNYSLRPVINATGVILHTNLGRAPLSSEALNHILKASPTYSNLEFDLESGERGKRDVHVERLFARIFDTHVGTAAPGSPSEQGSQEVARSPQTSTIVVNNNAAAVLLALNTLAEGAEVIVSRGELIEIGGSFRIPEIMRKSQAILREVGTTNRTSLSDYASAINEKTRLLLRVHRSNFAITGFTEQPHLEDLVSLARQRKIPLMEDLGSGALFDLRSIGIQDEPSVLDSLAKGVDVVTYSGDKLLGGPQAGILTGSPELIAKMRANSLFRALRVDKLTYAALEATLLAYVKQDYDAIPALRMMRLSKGKIQQRAEIIATKLRSPKIAVELIEGDSLIGGGAAPSAVLPTWLLAVTCLNISPDDLAKRLRECEPPIIARVQADRLVLDLRTVFPEHDDFVVDSLTRV